MEITKEEAKIILMGLRALQDDARSDEPHVAHGPEFQTLIKKVWKFVPGDVRIG